MSYTVATLTGHIRLNSYLRRVGIRDDPGCNYCGRTEESAKHFLCDCTELSHIRREVYNCDSLTPDEVMKSNIRNIFNFVKRSGRFPTQGTNYQTHSQNRLRDRGVELNFTQPMIPRATE